MTDIRQIQPRRLHLRSILVLHVDDKVDSKYDRYLQRFGDELRGATGLPVVVVPEGISLESVDEDDMRKAGWVRATKEAST